MRRRFTQLVSHFRFQWGFTFRRGHCQKTSIPRSHHVHASWVQILQTVFLKIPEELLDTSGRYEYVVLYSDTTDEDPYACEWDELSSYEEGHVSGVVLPEHGLAMLSLNHFCKFALLRRKKEKAIEIQVFSDYDDRAHEIKLTCLICPESVEDKRYERMSEISLSTTNSSLVRSTLSSETGLSLTARSESETSMSQPANTGSITSPTNDKAVNTQDLCECIEQLPYNEREKNEAYKSMEHFNKATKGGHPYHPLYTSLLDHMIPTPVLDMLYQLGYITNERKQEIDSEPANKKQNRCIYDDVLHRVPRDVLVDILQNSNQIDLASECQNTLDGKDEPK